MGSSIQFPSILAIQTVPNLIEPIVQEHARSKFAHITNAIVSRFHSLTEDFQRVRLRVYFTPFTAVCLGAAVVACYSLYKAINAHKIKLKLLAAINNTNFDNIFDFNLGKHWQIAEDRGKDEKLLEAVQNLLKPQPDVPEDSLTIVEKRFTEVTDSSEIRVKNYILACKSGEVRYDLDFAVGMRKGSTEIKSQIKAMGEDAYSADSVSIRFQGTYYEIPFIAMFDGGGGHTLAQHGREKFRAQFEKRLTEMVSISNRLDATVIAAAMKQADDDLFARFDDTGRPTFLGSGYAQLKANHDQIKRKCGIAAEDFKRIVREELGMCPREYHQYLNTNPQNKKKSLTIGSKEYDLSSDAFKEAQRDYELSMGIRESITVQVVASAFFINASRQLECITHNRGNCMALHANEDGTKALSERVSDMQINRSCFVLKSKDQVTLACYGVTEAVSIYELSKVNTMLREHSSLGYVETVMIAVAGHSGDDQSVMCVQIV